jgi:hypothetical protein
MYQPLESTELQTMPSGGENVRQQRKVGFVLCTSRQFQGIEICERHSQVLRLTALVRAHSNIPIRSASEPRIDTSAESRLAYPRVSFYTGIKKQIQRKYLLRNSYSGRRRR